jgi:hypothetical protein
MLEKLHLKHTLNKNMYEPTILIRHFNMLIGDDKTWKIALDRKIWGISTRFRPSWDKLDTNYFLAFYVTKPIQKIIGFGRITDKFIGQDFFWPDEILFKRSIWPYRFRFEVLFVTSDWNHGIPPPKNMMLNTGRKVVNENIFSDLLKQADKKWKTNMHVSIFQRN